jgi:ketosteroid isomerase-like protein
MSEVVGAFFAAISNEDHERAGSLLTEDVRWHRPPDVPITGTIEGAEEVQRMWATFSGSLDSFEVVPSRFESGGGLVMAPVTMRGSGSSGGFEFAGAQVFRVEDGRIAEVWEFRSLPEARELLSG